MKTSLKSRFLIESLIKSFRFLNVLEHENPFKPVKGLIQPYLLYFFILSRSPKKLTIPYFQAKLISIWWPLYSLNIFLSINICEHTGDKLCVFIFYTGVFGLIVLSIFFSFFKVGLKNLNSAHNFFIFTLRFFSWRFDARQFLFLNIKFIYII